MLTLPNRFKIHPTFHVSFLKPYYEDVGPSSRTQVKSAPPMIRKEFMKEHEKILDQKIVGKSKLNWRKKFSYIVEGGK